MNDINFGKQRDWVWRGWQIRYTYMRPQHPTKACHPPLILLHGFGASIAYWQHNLPVLSEHQTVYALDLLGFGASRKTYTNYGIDLWAQQVYQFWRTLINVPAILMGNSLGSLLSVILANQYPEMVQGLILINLPELRQGSQRQPKPIRMVFNGIRKLLTAPWLLRGLFYVARSRPVIRQLGVKGAYPAIHSRQREEQLVDFFSKPTYDEFASDAFVALAQSQSSSLTTSVKALLSNLEVPILLLWGERDRIIPLNLAESFVNVNPNLELVTFPQAGHCLHDEFPEQFHQQVLPWLERVSSGKMVNPP